MSNLQDLQNVFLKELIKEQVPVSIFLINGIKLHGIVDGYDEQTIMLKSTVTQMVYKNAVSTVVPSRMVEISAGE